MRSGSNLTAELKGAVMQSLLLRPPLAACHLERACRLEENRRIAENRPPDWLPSSHIMEMIKDRMPDEERGEEDASEGYLRRNVPMRLPGSTAGIRTCPRPHKPSSTRTC